MYKFKENSVVCFFGDSITRGGIWIRRVYDYYLNTLKIPCEMYNCGVSGDNARNAYGHIEESVMVYNPTDVVIAFGMNDFGYDLYDDRLVTEEVLQERRRRCDEFFNNLKKIADYFSERGIRVSFSTPTPTDIFTESEVPCHHGSAAALRELGSRIKVFAQNYGADVIDYYPYLYDFQKRMYKEGKSIMKEDRVHPNDLGAVLMSQVFLKEQSFDVEISDSFEQLEKIYQEKFSDWEEERYEIEQRKQSTEYVRFAEFCGVKDTEKIKEGIIENLKVQENEFVIGCFKRYLSEPDNLEEEQKALMKHTKNR